MILIFDYITAYCGLFCFLLGNYTNLSQIKTIFLEDTPKSAIYRVKIKTFFKGQGKPQALGAAHKYYNLSRLTRR